uniref:NADH-ubiquinone oxidoreductase chain 1 n=1 Tax=Dinocampus coccinellae TaxID=144245 RepID=A0A343YVD4_9HYME|nr:NADH dehydrogenase subunit 1 [Dinocampus coccinellae]
MNSIIMLIMVMIMIMVSVAFFTLFERKLMSLFHYRKGPNKISFNGLLQPFSDAFKLLTKEYFYPNKSNMYFYILSPLLMLILTLMMWLLYPFFFNLFNFKLSFLFFLSVMSMNVYSLMMGGWASNSTFSMIGAIRSVAQSISYEVTFAISMLIPLLLINSLNLHKMIFYTTWFPLMMYMVTLIVLISMLAEINRTPFDLTEGESELVSGFNVEYGSGKFTLIFLAEYSTLMFMMMIFTLMFLFTNSISIMFYLISMIMMYFITWVRMTFPRIRYDMLMYLCWFYLLPFILLKFMLILYVKWLLKMLIN